MILKCLRNYHQETTITLYLDHLLAEAEILKNLQLFKPSLKLLNKALQLARNHWRTAYLPPIYRALNGIYLLHLFEDMDDARMEAWRVEYEEAIELCKQKVLYENLYNRMIKLYSHTRDIKTKHDREQYLAIINHPLMKVDPSGLPFIVEITYLDIMGYYHLASNDMKKYSLVLNRVVSLMQGQPVYTSSLPPVYIVVLHNAAKANLLAGNKVMAKKMIDEMEKVIPKNKADEVRKKECLADTRMEFLRVYGKPGEITAWIDRHLKEIEGEYENESEQNYFALMYNIGLAFLTDGNPGRALDFFNRIVSVPLAENFNFYDDCRLFMLLAHYELHNFELMPHLIKSVNRSLNKQKSKTVFEQVLLSGLKKLTGKLKDKKALDQQLNLKSQLLATFKKETADKETILHREILAWLESKIQKKPMSQFLRPENFEKYFAGK